jgi:hypothetical protein
MTGSKKLAFALGGLAGNNAFGAGFLQASLQEGVRPDMISCTSGQLLWVSRYLRRLKGDPEGAGSLREDLAEDIATLESYKSYDLDCAALALWGKEGVYQPAGASYLADFWRNCTDSVNQIFKEKQRTFLFRRLLEMIPCRLLTPDFPDGFFEDISQTMHSASIGVVFNSYSPTEGREYVHVNGAARDFLTQGSDPGRRYLAGAPSSYRDRTVYADITPQAVRDALWLYFYGFNDNADARIDGAYFRDVILSELAPVDTIYVVRPMHHHWSGDLPRSWPEMEDLKTKVAFNGAYEGERSQMRLINHLLEAGKLQQAEKYHHVELVEIEMSRPRGFFGYVFEDMSVFDDAVEQAGRRLRGGHS